LPFRFHLVFKAFPFAFFSSDSGCSSPPGGDSPSALVRAILLACFFPPPTSVTTPFSPVENLSLFLFFPGRSSFPAWDGLWPPRSFFFSWGCDSVECVSLLFPPFHSQDGSRTPRASPPLPVERVRFVLISRSRKHSLAFQPTSFFPFGKPFFFPGPGCFRRFFLVTEQSLVLKLSPPLGPKQKVFVNFFPKAFFPLFAGWLSPTGIPPESGGLLIGSALLASVLCVLLLKVSLFPSFRASFSLVRFPRTGPLVQPCSSLSQHCYCYSRAFVWRNPPFDRH